MKLPGGGYSGGDGSGPRPPLPTTGSAVQRTPPPVITITEQEAHHEQWRHDFVLAALASEQEGHEQNVKMSRAVAENQREILARMAAGVPIDIVLKPPTKDDLRTYFMGEFAVILAAKGHLVGYEVIEQLADVAIGDV